MVRREIAHGNGGRSHRLRKHCRWRFLAFFESRCFLKVRPLVAGGVFMRWLLVLKEACNIMVSNTLPRVLLNTQVARIPKPCSPLSTAPVGCWGGSRIAADATRFGSPQ